ASSASVESAPPRAEAFADCLPVADARRFSLIHPVIATLDAGAQGPAPRRGGEINHAEAPNYLARVPKDWDGVRPVRILLAVHGVGGNGADFAGPLRWLA